MVWTVGQHIWVAFHEGDGKWKYSPAMIVKVYDEAEQLYITSLFRSVVHVSNIFASPDQAFQFCQQS